MAEAKRKTMSERKKRYSVFTPEQQRTYDALPVKVQKYILLRGRGLPRAEAYETAGYKPSPYSSSNANKMENFIMPQIAPLIKAMQGQKEELEVLKEGTRVSKKIDKQVEESIPTEMTMGLVQVDMDSPIVEVGGVDVDNITNEDARNIQFYRKIANGEIKSVKIRCEYDGEGKLVKRVVEENSDIDDRIKAQKEVARILGLRDLIELGKVEAENINITIVDASKKAETDVSKKVIDLDELKEVDGETVLLKGEGHIKNGTKRKTKSNTESTES